jgi:hypothetical protein
MLGYSSSDIHARFNDQYILMINVNDRPRYLHFIEALAAKEQTLTLQYRMICKGGRTIWINDTMTSRRLEDGHMYGFSVIADITAVRQSSSGQSSSVLDQVFNSCGFIQFSYGKYPKVTHINPQMIDCLGVDSENSDGTELLRQNLFFIIPIEEHDLFQDYMKEAQSSTKPVRIAHHFFTGNGNRIAMNGYMSPVKNLFGKTEYALIYTNDVHSADISQNIRDNSYFQALKTAYNMIFEISLSDQMVKCIHGRRTSAIGSLYDVQMTVESAKNFWLKHYVLEEDLDAMSEFLEKITTLPLKELRSAHVIQCEFRINWVDHQIHRLNGVAFQPDMSTVLLCCHELVNNHPAVLPEKEEKGIITETEVETETAYNPSKNRIFARTFGHFDLFVDHVPVVFSNQKEKEFLALLIDRNGGTVDTNEAISCLWEDEEISDRISRRYRKLCTTLKNTLAKYDIQHIVVNNHGVRSIDTTAITCDYYELLAGNEFYKNNFHNAYMTDYSWAEETLATLWNYS